LSALLTVTDLVKTHGRGRAAVRALDGVSLDVAPGEAVGLVGESGSGKTTLARCVLGLERPDAGSIRLGAAELVGLAPAARRALAPRLALVSQDPSAALDPRQTVRALVAEPLVVQRAGKPHERAVRVFEELESVGLSAAQANLYPHELSGGQRQRVAIARALIQRPELVVLDEPVSSLDVSIRAQILNLLESLRARHAVATLFIAHDLAVVRALCTRVVVLRAGRIEEHGTREDIFERPASAYTRALLASVPRTAR
jgi:ABC-type glutathione transport system ATPase component